MRIFTSDRALKWGGLDVPLLALGLDCYGQSMETVPGYCLILDPEKLWFLATHRSPAVVHPKSRRGVFLPELWKYDVAEVFIAHPPSGRYFEFNLAPNGAWWCCEFTAPRQRAQQEEERMPGVETYADLAPDGGWLAAMALPLDLLKARLDFGETSTLNVAMILNSPEQRFLSVEPLPGESPDFHQPASFPQAEFMALQDAMK
ncbi:MAG: hypothetical protein QM680_12810 [Luteolibacter sp.]